MTRFEVYGKDLVDEGRGLGLDTENGYGRYGFGCAGEKSSKVSRDFSPARVPSSFQHGVMLKNGKGRLGVQDFHGFFAIAVHDIGDTGDLGTFLCERHDLPLRDGVDPETA